MSARGPEGPILYGGARGAAGVKGPPPTRPPAPPPPPSTSAMRRGLGTPCSSPEPRGASRGAGAPGPVARSWDRRPWGPERPSTQGRGKVWGLPGDAGPVRGGEPRRKAPWSLAAGGPGRGGEGPKGMLTSPGPSTSRASGPGAAEGPRGGLEGAGPEPPAEGTLGIPTVPA